MGPRGTPAAALALFAFLAPSSDREFRGKRVPVAEPPRSILLDHHPVRPVEGPIQVGSVEFAATVAGGRLSVATAPGAPADQAVVAGKPVRFSWDDKGTPRSVLLTFTMDGAGKWRRFASEALRFDVAGEDLRLFDSDGDGCYGVAGRDGWTVGGGEYVLPLERNLILGPRVLSNLRVDAAVVVLTANVAPLFGTKGQVATAVALNRLRTPHGLPPVWMDEGLSAGCTLHAKHLAAKGWSGSTSPYPDGKGNDGESPEGVAAALRSIIGTYNTEATIEFHWRTCLSRWEMAEPFLRRIGANAEPTSIAVVDCADGSVKDVPVPVVLSPDGVEDPLPVYDWPVFVPADATTDHPTHALESSNGEPVADFARRGTPLLAMFDRRVRVEGFTGSLVAEGGAAMPVIIPAVGPMQPHRAIVPEKPLRSKAWYRATYSWSIGGTPASRTIRFRTR